MAVMGSLMGHLIYGVILGAVAGELSTNSAARHTSAPA
jgi:hypothetical protein